MMTVGMFVVVLVPFLGVVFSALSSTSGATYASSTLSASKYASIVSFEWKTKLIGTKLQQRQSTLNQEEANKMPVCDVGNIGKTIGKKEWFCKLHRVCHSFSDTNYMKMMYDSWGNPNNYKEKYCKEYHNDYYCTYLLKFFYCKCSPVVSKGALYKLTWNKLCDEHFPDRQNKHLPCIGSDVKSAFQKEVNWEQPEFHSCMWREFTFNEV